jgi:lactoylglutathione lyase
MASDVSTYAFNHTMIRVLDPVASIAFYEEVLGMKLLTKMDMKDFTLYFLAYVREGEVLPQDEDGLRSYVFSREGVLELTHNKGHTEPYHNGNSEPGRGFGHICVCVDDLHAACQRFKEKFQDRVKFIKEPNSGSMKNIAFIADPDGYWVEIVARGLPRA